MISAIKQKIIFYIVILSLMFFAMIFSGVFVGDNTRVGSGRFGIALEVLAMCVTFLMGLIEWLRLRKTNIPYVSVSTNESEAEELFDDLDDYNNE